jgi:hypothetical protein
VLCAEEATDGKHFVSHNKCYDQILVPQRPDLLGRTFDVTITEHTKFCMIGEVVEASLAHSPVLPEPLAKGALSTGGRKTRDHATVTKTGGSLRQRRMAAASGISSGNSGASGSGGSGGGRGDTMPAVANAASRSGGVSAAVAEAGDDGNALASSASDAKMPIATAAPLHASLGSFLVPAAIAALILDMGWILYKHYAVANTSDPVQPY